MPLLSKVNATANRIANPGREQSLQNPCKKVVQKIKRAGPSHKPHPKATCPHPTRPLRPPGRRAPDDYAQVTRKMQPKVLCFFGAFGHPKSQPEMTLLTADRLEICAG